MARARGKPTGRHSAEVEGFTITMDERTYRNFDLLVEGSDDAGAYRVSVLDSPTGETGPVPVTLPFSDEDVAAFLSAIGHPRQRVRRGERVNLAPRIEEFGAQLFDVLFPPEIRLTLAKSLGKAESEDAGLRIRLRFSRAPELADLPWEFVFDRSAGRHLALSDWTPLVRYLQIPTGIRPFTVTPPLRVLVVAASPVDFEGLDTAGETERLHEALADLVATNSVVLEELETGTFSGLQRQLRRQDYHILHYIGHGGFDDVEDDGVLYFEGPKRRSQAVTGQELGELLHDHRSLRLVILNACEGARSGREDPFGGTAQSLVLQGIPAVVAMQFEITDDAAITLAHSLYEAIADGYPLDAAMAQARKSVKSMPNAVEWANPVLHMRAPDGRVFAVDTTQRGSLPGPDDVTLQAPPAEEREEDITTPRLIRTPDQKIRVYVSSMLRELAAERQAARGAIERLRMTPVMWELGGARAHPPQALYRSYLQQSDIFVGIYGAAYGWVGPGEQVSGLEDEYGLAPPHAPKLIYLRADADREARLQDLIHRMQEDDSAAFFFFDSPEQLEEQIGLDLAALLAESFWRDHGR